MYETILKDLKERFGDKVILTPADIAPVIASSPGVQANHRSRGGFPIPIRKIGTKVGVTIYHLAEYLATGEVVVQAPKPNTTSLKSKPTPSRSVSPRSKAWLMAFQAQIQFQFELAKHIQVIFLDLETRKHKADKNFGKGSGKI